jgi:uncharacterized RDD family membrane protein YckC
MSVQWYYAQQGQRKGPLPEEQLRQLVASGQMAPGDLVWKDGMPGWVPVSKVFPPAATNHQAPADRWYYSQQGQQKGPLPEVQLRQLVASGQIGPTDLVWKPGMTGWVPASQLFLPSPVYDNAPPSIPTHYAGFWIRVAALFIDYLVTLVPCMLVRFAMFTPDYSDEPTHFTSDFERAGFLIGLGLGTTIINSLLCWIYFAILESSIWQGSVGKKVLGLRVTDMNGQRISFGHATGRYFSKIVSGLIFGIGFLMVGWTERKQGLHDMMAGTLVVKQR